MTTTIYLSYIMISFSEDETFKVKRAQSLPFARV